MFGLKWLADSVVEFINTGSLTGSINPSLCHVLCLTPVHFFANCECFLGPPEDDKVKNKKTKNKKQKTKNKKHRHKTKQENHYKNKNKNENKNKIKNKNRSSSVGLEIF
jgi:hypothetical protein